jgi:phosphoribosylformylglycinamidine cyclo-ligase
LIENIPRVLPKGIGATIDTNSWEVPEIFNYLQKAGNIDTNEMFRVLNCGVGMVVVVKSGDEEKTIENLTKNGEKAWKIGEIVSNTAGDDGAVSFV